MTVHGTPDTDPRFALFAEFDDGVVTDITRIGFTVAAWDRAGHLDEHTAHRRP